MREKNLISVLVKDGNAVDGERVYNHCTIQDSAIKLFARLRLIGWLQKRQDIWHHTWQFGDFHNLILRVETTVPRAQRTPPYHYLYSASQRTTERREQRCFSVLKFVSLAWTESLCVAFQTVESYFSWWSHGLIWCGQLLHFAYNSGIAASQSLQDWV